MKRRLSTEDRILLFGLPVLVAALLIGWGIWRATATLDDIEARQLAMDPIWKMTGEHLMILVICAALVLCTAIPLGILLTRPKFRFLSPVATSIANAGQSAPVIGVIVLLAIWIGFGLKIAVLSLSVYAFLPVLSNTIAGLRAVDPQLVESARGMGMSSRQLLTSVELPLALPVIMSGVRTALVLLAGTAVFATFVDAGGLGGLIQAGISLYRNSILFSGSLLIGSLALLVEWLGRLAEVWLKPKGL